MENGRRPEAINTQFVFRVYAVAACLGGFLLAGWAPVWFDVHLPGLPYGKAALLLVLGTFIMAVGFCAAGFATVDDPAARRRGLFWFAMATQPSA